VVYPPVGDPELAARELDLGGRLPDSYRAFVKLTNGLDYRDLHLAGIHDLYPLENTHLPLLHLAWDGDDQDDFVVAIPHDGRDQATYRIDVHDPDARPKPIAGDFRDYLKKTVE
jgi:hypothetical protein